ncbi:hypothetical protein C6401_13995 [Arthrobacter woluwensis]|uniref:hypothetical protein n=1 Tax=Arthrobacter woluwensis TaxID=156980 RepID=UPI000D1356D8|nr:hypothetical protein [Arthrobacter woluwensis]PSS43151.1 hypothetical protein C6401_13995 [Arthrobacter woluwensis]
MRIVSKTWNIVDNPVQNQYEIYRDGFVQGVVRYRIEGTTMRFFLCQAKGLHTESERRAFYLAAARDAKRRRLNVEITSRSMAEGLAPLAKVRRIAFPGVGSTPQRHAA